MRSILFSTAIAIAMAFGHPAKAEESSRHFVWQIQDDDNTVYLLGSLHLLKPENYPLPDIMEEAYREAEIVVFETDIDAAGSPEIQASMVARGMYTDGRTLRDGIAEDAYVQLESRFAELGMTMQQLAPLKPWLCAVTLTVMELQRLGFDPSIGIDSHFMRMANRDGKEKQYLEEVMFQINLFADMTEDEQRIFMEQTLKDLEIVEQMTEEMEQAWQTGDDEKLGELFELSLKDFPSLYDRLVTQRNRSWIPHIESLIEGSRNALVIVGAGHLVGKNNVRELLQSNGHNLEQQ